MVLLFCLLFHAKLSETEQITNLLGDPPQLSITIPNLKDLQVTKKPWECAQLPTDVLWLTVADAEFLACFFYLGNVFKCYKEGLGYVYFGEVNDGKEKVKISLIRCCRGSTLVGGSQNVVRNAIEILKPKAVFSVGYCGGLSKEKTKLGDVVISSKLSTYAEKKIISDRQQWCGNTINVSKNIGDLMRTAADGWRAPLLDPEALEVEVHRDVEILSGPELENSPRESEELLKKFPGAIAIEAEGQGNSHKLWKFIYYLNIYYLNTIINNFTPNR